MPVTRSEVCTASAEIESSDPRIACRSSDSPETNTRSLISRSESSLSRLPMVTITWLRFVISEPITWSRLASVW